MASQRQKVVFFILFLPEFKIVGELQAINFTFFFLQKENNFFLGQCNQHLGSDLE